MAADSLSLHLDLFINLTSHTYDQIFNISVLNVYAGFQGFTLEDIVTVNKNSNHYSYFIVLYAPVDKSTSPMLAYYQYSHKFATSNTISHTKAA